MIPVTTVWSRLKSRIKAAKKKLLFLDFDGTLVPIAKTPSAVVFDRKIRKIIDKLCRRNDTVLCIISGRSIGDLKKYFGDRRVLFVGNHGFEFQRGKIASSPQVRKAKKLSALIWLMAEKLKEDLGGMRGILIENKTYTLSVHYRNLPGRFLPIFRKKLKILQKKYAHLPLVWKTGKKAWSVHPAIQWNKGEATLYICRHYPKALPIIIGDDVTDEDMFRALRSKAITIRVGRSRKSFAEFYLKSTKFVALFLEEMSNL